MSGEQTKITCWSDHSEPIYGRRVPDIPRREHW
jgi:hypothetical protein